MTRLVFLLFPLVGLLGAWAGSSGGAGAAAAVAVLGGLAAAVVAWTVGARRIRELSRGVNAWMGKVEIEAVDTRGGPDHRELATALNTLGAAYGRRGRRLVEREPVLGDLVQALPEPSLLFSVDGILVASNLAARALFGDVRDEGTTALQALGSSDLADLIARGDGRQIEVVVARRVLQARATAFAGHVLLSVRDLTAARRVESIRRDFVTNASHELKTPVAGIHSLADALDVVLDKDPAKARSLLARLRGEAERLTTLVGDLLALRRVDGDGALDDAQDLDVVRIAAEVLATAAMAADQRGIEISLEAPERLVVRAVEEDVRLVLTNLVVNGVKYNRDGGTLAVHVRDTAAGGVRVEVIDSGIGIPRGDLDRVFERFYRVDPGRSREEGGTGLGLAIVRHAVQRHGGHVEVDSLLGRGSTFAFELPSSPSRTGRGSGTDDGLRGEG